MAPEHTSIHFDAHHGYSPSHSRCLVYDTVQTAGISQFQDFFAASLSYVSVHRLAFLGVLSSQVSITRSLVCNCMIYRMWDLEASILSLPTRHAKALCRKVGQHPLNFFCTGGIAGLCKHEVDV